jgi:magnesium chelatase family protein
VAGFRHWFQLFDPTNPCLCGWLEHPSRRCRCSPDQIARYRSRVSGPLLDRIDLAIEVPSVTADALAISHAVSTIDESSADVRARVIAAHAVAHERQGKPNARLSPAEVVVHCRPEAEAKSLRAKAMSRLSLSARAYHRILKVARTIADLVGKVNVTAAHVAEAIQLRRLDRAN